MKKYIILICTLFYSFVAQSQEDMALLVKSTNFKRLYRISDELYRSEQPSRKGFKELESIGIKTILNLRRSKFDDRKARDLDFDLKNIKLKAKLINEDDLINALKVIRDSKKPILIHCWHGSDRTGVLIAAYRIIFNNWSKSDAIEEFRRQEFNYHEKWYPNLIDLLNDLNVNRIQTELDLK
jgi:protein tyrosine/serine phosphatase